MQLKSIKAKMFLVLFTSIILTVAITGSIAATLSFLSTTKNARAELNKANSMASAKLSEQVRTNVISLGSFADRYIKKYLAIKTSANEAEALADFEKFYGKIDFDGYFKDKIDRHVSGEAIGYIKYFAVITKDGTVRYENFPSYKDKKIIDSTIVSKAIEKKVTIIDVESVEGINMLSIGYPIMDGANFVGILYTRLDLTKFPTSISDTISKDTTMEYLLTDSVGSTLYSTRGYKEANKVITSLMTYYKEAIKKTIDVTFIGVSGKRQYGNISYIKDLEWFLIIGRNEAEILQPVELLIMSLLIGSSLIIFIGLILSLKLADRIVKPIKNAKKFVQKIGMLDLTYQDELKGLTKSNDEIGEMILALSIMGEKLRESLIAINEVSQEIKADSHHITTNVYDISQNITASFNAIEDISSGLEEMDASAEEVAIKINEIDCKTTDMLQSIQECACTTLEVYHKTDEVNKKSIESKEAIDVLYSQYKSNIRENIDYATVSLTDITELINIVKRISTKTNILSMNASIEAARAGSYGKGFNVVANEIRELSYGVNDSAKSIENIIKTIKETVDKLSLNVIEILNFIENDIQADFTYLIETFTSHKLDIEGISHKMKYIDHEICGVSKNTINMASTVQETTRAVSASAQEAQVITQSNDDIYKKIQNIEQIICNNTLNTEKLYKIVSRFKLE